MIVRSLDELKASGAYREKAGVWSSARYLVRDDNVGITLTETRVSAGASQIMEYKNHMEANLVIDGEGVVIDHATGDRFALVAGSMYTLDKHDRHTLEATTDMRLVCVFLPALVGTETHDEDGSYPLL